MDTQTCSGVLVCLGAATLLCFEECRAVCADIYDGLRKPALDVRVPIRKPRFGIAHAGVYLHYVCKVKWFLWLLRKNRMWGFSGGYTAQRFTNCMAQLLCRGFLCQRRKIRKWDLFEYKSDFTLVRVTEPCRKQPAELWCLLPLLHSCGSSLPSTIKWHYQVMKLKRHVKFLLDISIYWEFPAPPPFLRLLGHFW